MTPPQAEDLKHTLSSVFQRKGSNGHYTRLFDSLDSSQRDILLTSAAFRCGELPIMANVRDRRDWLVLTTERLVWCVGDETHELAINDIRDAVADFKVLQRTNQTKLQMHQLQISTMSNQEFTINLEPGAPLSGVWSVLKNLGARNRRKVG